MTLLNINLLAVLTKTKYQTQVDSIHELLTEKFRIIGEANVRSLYADHSQNEVAHIHLINEEFSIKYFITFYRYPDTFESISSDVPEMNNV